MKKNLFRLLQICLAAFVLSAMLVSCAGEDGLDGKDGDAGTDGIDGVDGANANQFCKNCHNNTNMNAIAEDLEGSLHVSGASWADETNRNSCGPCHAHDGFNEAVKTGQHVNMAGIPYASHLNCKTCHDFHTTLDSTEFPDYALRTIDTVAVRINKTTTYVAVAPSTTPTFNITFAAGSKFVPAFQNGESNICISCHQARTVSPWPDIASTTNLTITNFRYGTHYGTAGNIFAGKGGIEFAGTATYSNSVHTTGASCGACHITKASATSHVGGHNFTMKEGTEINLDGCKTCHADATTYDINGKQTEIKGLLNQLGNKLDIYLDKDASHPVIAGLAKDWSGYIDIYDASNNPDGAYRNAASGNVAFVVSPKVAAGIVNFQLVLRDRSLGVHNYAYTKALLTNTIAEMP